MRLIDADKVPPLSDMSGCGYEGSEYQAYKSGAEYVRGLVDDTPTIDPETLRPMAHWIVTKTNVCGMNRYECSSCGAIRFRATAIHLNYCAECGKRMVSRVRQKDGERK